MSTDNLKVATLTANYNNSKYFDDCITGILNQSRIPDYIVIVDDASTDNSVDIIHEKLEEYGGIFDKSGYQPKMDGSHNWFPRRYNFGQGNSRITQAILFPQKENKGPAATRNIGLNYLIDKSDVICIADSDDVLYPNKLKKSIEILLKYPQVALVYSDYDIYTEAKDQTVREFKEPYSYNRLFQECIVSNNSAIATSILKQVGTYDESLFGPEDYDLWLRIAEVGCVYHIPESLYKYRVSGNNITVTTPPQKFAEHVNRVHQKAIERRNKNLKQ